MKEKKTGSIWQSKAPCWILAIAFFSFFHNCKFASQKKTKRERWKSHLWTVFLGENVATKQSVPSSNFARITAPSNLNNWCRREVLIGLLESFCMHKLYAKGLWKRVEWYFGHGIFCALLFCNIDEHFCNGNGLKQAIFRSP